MHSHYCLLFLHYCSITASLLHYQYDIITTSFLHEYYIITTLLLYFYFIITTVLLSKPYKKYYSITFEALLLLHHCYVNTTSVPLYYFIFTSSLLLSKPLLRHHYIITQAQCAIFITTWSFWRPITTSFYHYNMNSLLPSSLLPLLPSLSASSCERISSDASLTPILIACACACAHPSLTWRGGPHFHKAEYLPLLSLSMKLVCARGVQILKDA
jgi:hypothetical protein